MMTKKFTDISLDEAIEIRSMVAITMFDDNCTILSSFAGYVCKQKLLNKLLNTVEIYTVESYADKVKHFTLSCKDYGKKWIASCWKMIDDCG